MTLLRIGKLLFWDPSPPQFKYLILHGTRARRADVSVPYHRPGRYLMDVILEFSAALAEPTLGFYQQAVGYEGYHIPGSPFSVFVAAAPSSPPRQPACKLPEVGTSPGEWVLQTTSAEQPVNFTAAPHAWQPHACRLPDSECLHSWAENGQGCLPAGHRIMLVMVGGASILHAVPCRPQMPASCRRYGVIRVVPLLTAAWRFPAADSLTRKQMNALVKFLGEEVDGEGEYYIQTTKNTLFDTHFQAINGGLRMRMADIERAIDSLAECQAQADCHPVLHFNSGLHDLDKYCLISMAHWRREQGYENPDNYDCIKSYHDQLQHVIDYAASSGMGGVKIFRSTTAAWLKFGNWRVNWTEHRDLQAFTQSWHTVEGFNGISVPLFKAAGWHIVDGFMSTVGRPDHTEVTSSNGAFVHFEDEVCDLHNQQMLALVMGELCHDSLEGGCRGASMWKRLTFRAHTVS